MYYQSFTVVGIINVETLDAGLVSLVEEPVRIKAVIINCDTHEGNLVQGWIGTDRILQIYDYNLDTQEESAADTPPFSSVKMGRIPIEENIPPGQIFKIGVLCGAVQNTLFGAYEYDKII